jgi:5-formyltetrahydrofolate cyclo-ligase
MRKEEVRQSFLDKRMALSPEETARLNEQLVDQFFRYTRLENIHVIHCYLPIAPDTRLIINRLRKDHPTIRISIPKMNAADRLMEHFYFVNEDQLLVNRWGIPEPVYGVSTLASEIDLVIVPLLAFDEQGHRVGYGKGFYDKFLPNCKADCQKTGISFFGPVIIDDINHHDQKLTNVITPEKQYQF